MTQDTRKDRRVKIVSLNVRYKSATVDEFIENHAHDVSRGGIFIKTTNPFAGGTLLKFEIRLVSDQAVIAGVGRVVWKRDAATATADHPAGMGVKFIKVDEPSKAVIDRLINSRADAGKSFEEEREDAVVAAPTGLASSAHMPATAPPTTVRGPGAPAQSAPPAGREGGATIATRSSPPRPQKSGMFPQAEFEKETYPKQEQTVMKQAAELLEEALREAGGSMEEVGHNPLFAEGASRISASTAVSPSEISGKKEALSVGKTGESTRVPSEKERPEEAADAAARAKAMLAGMSPGATKPSSGKPKAVSGGARSPASDRPTRSGAPLSKVPGARKTPKKPAPKMAIVVGAGLAVAVALFVFRDTLFGDGAETSTDPVQTNGSAASAVSPLATAAPTVTPEPSAAASGSTTVAPEASEPPAAPRESSSAAAPSVAGPSPRASTSVTASASPIPPTIAAPPTPAPPPPPPPRAVVAAPPPSPPGAAVPAPPASASLALPAGGAPQASAAPARPAPPRAVPRGTSAPKAADDNPY